MPAQQALLGQACNGDLALTVIDQQNPIIDFVTLA